MEKELKYLENKLQNLKYEEMEFVERGATYGLNAIRKEIKLIENIIHHILFYK